MMIRIILSMAIIALLMPACTMTPVNNAIMYNAQTKETAQCAPDQEWRYLTAGQDQVNHCVNAYEKAGYKRIDDHPEAK